MSDPTREEYTPTTYKAQAAYVLGSMSSGRYEGNRAKRRSEFRAEFHRWLAGELRAAKAEAMHEMVSGFADQLRAAKAEAWDEGWEACHKFMGRGIFPPITNPYRQEGQ